MNNGILCEKSYTSGKSNYDIIVTELASECASYIGSKRDLSVIYIIPSPKITHMEYSVFTDV